VLPFRDHSKDMRHDAKMYQTPGAKRGTERDFDYFRTVNIGLMMRKGGRKPPFFFAQRCAKTA